MTKNRYYQCPGCKQAGASSHYMRCIKCYRPFLVKELKEAKRNEKNART